MDKDKDKLNLQKELFRKHRESQAHIGDLRKMMEFYEKEMNWIEDTIAVLNGDQNGEPCARNAAEEDASIIAKVRESKTQLGALEIIAQENSGHVQLEYASRVIRMANMSNTTVARLVSTLRQRVNESTGWEMVGKDTARMAGKPAQQEPSEGTVELPEHQTDCEGLQQTEDLQQNEGLQPDTDLFQTEGLHQTEGLQQTEDLQQNNNPEPEAFTFNGYQGGGENPHEPGVA